MNWWDNPDRTKSRYDEFRARDPRHPWYRGFDPLTGDSTMTAVQPITIGREENGTYFVAEPGQSPQKLTKEWRDVATFIGSRFGIDPSAEVQKRTNEQVRQEQATANQMPSKNAPEPHETTPFRSLSRDEDTNAHKPVAKGGKSA